MTDEDEARSKKLFKQMGGTLQPDGSVAVGPDWEMPVVYPTKRKFAAHKEDDMAETDTDEIQETRKSRAALIEKPVENSGPVPLMPNLDSNARHVITSIRVHKRTPPNDGIKGDVPESTTVEFIARRWGDGIYDFEALNEAGQVLRRNTNVKIAMGYQQPMEPGLMPGSPLQRMMVGGGSSDVMHDKLLERLDKESARAHEASSSAVQVTKQLSQDYASMIREDSKDRSEKDRAYHKAQADQQGNFFQTMLMSMQTMHEQSMERSREQFQQTLQMMQFSHQQTLSQNNPALLFQLFERGLRFGAEAGGGEEESPLTSILGAATQGLSTVKDMMLLQTQQNPAMLPASTPKPARTNPAPTAKTPAISKADMMEVIRLKKIAESKGLDFSGLVKQAQTMVSNMPSEEPDEDEEEDDGTENDAEESGDSNLA